MKMAFLAIGTSVLLLSLPVHGLAQKSSPAVNEETNQGVPSMEMLEFLASFEDEDAGWLDPQILMDVDEWKDEDTDNDITQEEHDGQ